MTDAWFANRPHRGSGPGSSSPGETRVSTQPTSTPRLLAISLSEWPSSRSRSTSSARQTSPRSSKLSPRLPGDATMVF